MKRLLTTIDVARAVGINRVTLQKWIRIGRIKPPRLIIRNGRSVRLWSPAQVREVRILKARSDYWVRVIQQAKAEIARSKAHRMRGPRQGRLDFRK